MGDTKSIFKKGIYIVLLDVLNDFENGLKSEEHGPRHGNRGCKPKQPIGSDQSQGEIISFTFC